MYDSKSSRNAVLQALDNLEDLFKSIREKYDEDLAKGEYEHAEDTVLSKENVMKMSEEIMSQRRGDDVKPESQEQIRMQEDGRSHH